MDPKLRSLVFLCLWGLFNCFFFPHPSEAACSFAVFLAHMLTFHAPLRTHLPLGLEVQYVLEGMGEQAWRFPFDWQASKYVLEIEAVLDLQPAELSSITFVTCHTSFCPLIPGLFICKMGICVHSHR